MSLNTITELLVYALTALCLAHAYRQGKGWLALYIGACLNGLVPEMAAVRTHIDYEYARFLIMVPPGKCPDVPLGAVCTDAVPIWVVLGWGFVVYVAMQTTARLNIAWYLKPGIDALLAVNFDWLMDPLAVRLGWWVWDQPGEFFGVPLDNFIGWMICVAGFSFSVRAARRYWFRTNPKFNDNLTPLLAALGGPAILYVVMKTYAFVWQVAGVSDWLLLGVALAVMLSIALAPRTRSETGQRPDWFVVGAALFFLGYFGVLLWHRNVFADHPPLITVAALTSVVGWFGYTTHRASA